MKKILDHFIEKENVYSCADNYISKYFNSFNKYFQKLHLNIIPNDNLKFF